ncbi:hypothetical protein VTP01DRAFT_7452 [Rhizomucor pusillus]
MNTPAAAQPPTIKKTLSKLSQFILIPERLIAEFYNAFEESSPSGASSYF